MPDSNTVAIGAFQNWGNGAKTGHVRVYSWNGSTWSLKGADIDGEAMDDQSGKSVYMPDPNTLAVGAQFNNGNGSNAGHVRIFTWNGASWVQKGMDLDGEAVGDQSGVSISMPNANVIAIGAPLNDDGGNLAGHVRVYTWDGSSWNKLGTDIDGVGSLNYHGHSVSMPSANTIAVGAWGNSDNGPLAGQVRVFTLSKALIVPESEIGCGEFIWPANGLFYTATGIYTDTLQGINGCDSIVQLDLVINQPDSTYQQVSACESFTWPVNGQTYISSGQYTTLLTNDYGCDSLLYLDLTIEQPDSVYQGITTCDSYFWPVNGQIYTTSGIYYSSLVSSNGCDSLIYLDLSIITKSPIQNVEQLAHDLNGEAASDLSGQILVMPDSETLAIGAQYNDGNGQESGHVRVFKLNGNVWQPKGLNIDGEAAGDRSGIALDMPNANTIAIGAHLNDGSGNAAGHVRVFTWTGSTWVQKGLDIDGEAVNDNSGFSVSMPDANTVAIGATFNDGGGSLSGHARIYKWNGSSWIQKGQDLDGVASIDFAGYRVVMPDSNTIAISAINNDGSGSEAGHVRIFTWDGTQWIQQGTAIQGASAGDQAGFAISMPDALTIAVGSPKHAGVAANSGQVRVFTWNGSNWVQRGANIEGENLGDQLGYSVSMPTTNLLAASAPFADPTGPTSGTVSIYRWNGVSWIKISEDIVGEVAYEQSGIHISMADASTIAIGAPFRSDSGPDAGQTRIYKLTDQMAPADSMTACNSYTWPANGQTYSASGLYSDTIADFTGCDSVVQLNLVISQPDSTYLPVTSCVSYTWPANGVTYTLSGEFTTLLSNTRGCDSLVYLDLIILNPDSLNQDSTACDSMSNARAANNNSINPEVVRNRDLPATRSMSDSDLETLPDPELEVFPNPTSDELNIWIQAVIGERVDILLLDATGKTIERVQMETYQSEVEHKLKLGEYPKGVYMLNVVLSRKVLTKRIIRR